MPFTKECDSYFLNEKRNSFNKKKKLHSARAHIHFLPFATIRLVVFNSLFAGFYL